VDCSTARCGGAAARSADSLLRPAGPLHRRLLAHLIHRPGLLLALPPAARERLGAHPDPDLLVEVVRYVAQNPEAEPVEILGRWSGTAAHALLLQLLQAPLAIDEHAQQGEFTDGVAKLLLAIERAERQRLLAELREDPTREKLAEFWLRKQGAASGEPAAVRADAAAAGVNADGGAGAGVVDAAGQVGPAGPRMRQE